MRRETHDYSFSLYTQYATADRRQDMQTLSLITITRSPPGKHSRCAPVGERDEVIMYHRTIYSGRHVQLENTEACEQQRNHMRQMRQGDNI